MIKLKNKNQSYFEEKVIKKFIPEMMDFIPKEEETFKSTRHIALLMAIDMLNGRDKKIITDYYFRNRSYRLISKELRVSIVRVSQLKIKALNHLKKNIILKLFLSS